MDTQNSALALRQYLWGLPFYGLYKIFAPSFFALDKPKIPVYISVSCIIVNIIFCVSLVPSYGYGVLALGTSLSMMLNCTLQGGFLSKHLGLGVRFFLPLRLFKVLFAALDCGAVAEYLSQSFYQVSENLLVRGVSFLGISAGAGAIYFCFSQFWVKHHCSKECSRRNKSLFLVNNPL